MIERAFGRIRGTVDGAVAGLRSTWDVGRTRDRAFVVLVVVAAATLVGAFLFGAWHVLVGGFVLGNWRAGGFGLVLAAVTGTLLAAGVSLVARRR